MSSSPNLDGTTHHASDAAAGTEPLSKAVASDAGADTAPAPAITTETKDAEDEFEPQNTLTEKFTPAEWVALKEFRVRITRSA